MPESGRHHQRSDNVHEREYERNRDGDYSYDDGRGRNNHRPKHPDQRGSAGDRRAKQDRQRDVTSSPHRETSAYRDHHHEGPSRLSRESPVYHPEEGEFYEQPHKTALYNLRYILTSRGFAFGAVTMDYFGEKIPPDVPRVVDYSLKRLGFFQETVPEPALRLTQLMEVFVNLLLVICAGVPHSNNGGYRDLASLGGLYYYHFGGANAFAGADADRIKELDRLFHQLKRPPYIFAMVWGGVLMIYALAMLALGIFRVPYRRPPVLLGEALLNLLIGLGYIPALAFYFIKLQETYNNRICTEREEMYKSKGHKGFECKYHGADIASGLFAVLGVFVFILGGVLAFKAFRSVRELKKQRTNEEANL